MTDSVRVRRPLGLTLAIIGVAILYGILPLAEVYFLHRVTATADDELYLLGGVDVSQWVWIQGAVGAVILIICILAWWGRPPWIRFVMVGALVLLTIINLYRVFEAVTGTTDPIFGGQTQSIMRGFLRCQLPAIILVPLYAAWYLNRAPARAFYRRVPLAAPVEDSKDTR